MLQSPDKFSGDISTFPHKLHAAFKWIRTIRLISMYTVIAWRIIGNRGEQAENLKSGIGQNREITATLC